MVTKIKEELRKIEAAENVKITLAVESGSRAWGIDEINEYIERKLEEIQSAADALVDTKTEWEPLNELFLKILDGR